MQDIFWGGISCYSMGGIPLIITPSALFMVYAVAIVPVLVATVVPAWKNAITEPDIVLRGV